MSDPLSHLIALPGAIYQRISRKLPGRAWYSRVDARVLLGAMPFARDVATLHALGVRGVINMCAEYPGPGHEYERLGMEQLHLPTRDFTPPSLEQVRSALDFIGRVTERGEQTFVHCKAGRGRSGIVALCYLVYHARMTPREAQARLVKIRPRIVRDLHRREVVSAIAAGEYA